MADTSKATDTGKAISEQLVAAAQTVEQLRAELEREERESAEMRRRLEAAKAAYAELAQQISAQSQMISALEARYSSRTDANLRMPLRGVRGWPIITAVVLLALGGGLFGGTQIRVSATSTATVLGVSAEFAEKLRKSGSYWTLTADEQSEVDRALEGPADAR